VSEFGDIFYVPALGTRQYRLKLAGVKAGAWTGALSAAGYVYNPPGADEWITGKDYKTGDIVIHNNLYYSAKTITEFLSTSTTPPLTANECVVLFSSTNSIVPLFRVAIMAA
jgi:hypothetical protein